MMRICNALNHGQHPPCTPHGITSRDDSALAEKISGNGVDLIIPPVKPLTRRGFFKFMSAAAAGVVVAPELIELLKPRPTIFIPGPIEVDYSAAFAAMRAFVPAMVIQIYHTSPLLSQMLKGSVYGNVLVQGPVAPPRSAVWGWER